MKRLTTFIFILLASLSFAQNKQQVIDSLISGISTPSEPYRSGNFIVFTAKDTARYVGISCDIDNFKTIRSFQRLVSYDYENVPQGSILFYLLELPENISKVSYRYIIDGLWTTDPLNQNKEFNRESGTYVSTIIVDRPETYITQKDDNVVRFVYDDTPGQIIRLAGSFTNWDSFIYYLTETTPGRYELELPLPNGTYYYAFYNGLSSLLDQNNPNRVYTTDGRIASVITVN